MELVLVGLGFALVALPMILLALRAFAKIRAIRRWPRAPGVVTSSFLESSRSTSKDRNGFTVHHTSYTPVVHFTFTVNGQQHQGTQMALEATSTGAESAAADIARYPLGAQVQAYCDPAHPSTAYLEVRRSIGAIILLCFGCVLMVPALIVWSVAAFGS